MENKNMSISYENMGTVNKNKVVFKSPTKKLELVFSYETIVHFYYYDKNNNILKTGTIENNWGRTTGKLLGQLEPDKKKRLTQNDFQKKLNEVLNNSFN